MTMEQWLLTSVKQLQDVNIGTARLDCLVLLEDCLKLGRAHILAHPELLLSAQKLDFLNDEVTERARHKPLAYIRGKAEFYGREFIVTQDVLVPRPESEMIIDMLLKLDLPKNPRIVDIGSGSGNLGITAQLELPSATVDLIDIDKNALGVAQQNVQKHNLHVSCISDHLIENALVQYDVILANLPYVPESYPINEAAMNEPPIAIFGGFDGLDLYRMLFTQLRDFDWKPAYVLTESLPSHHDKLARIASGSGFKVTDTNDFIQLFSVI